MEKQTLSIIIAVMLATRPGFGAGKAADIEKPSIPFKRAQITLETQQMLDEKHTNFNRRLIRMFGKRDLYTPAQIAAVLDPKISDPRDPGPPRANQKGPVPRDTFSRSMLDERYTTLEEVDPATKDTKQRLIDRSGPGPQDYYRADQVRDAEKRKDDKPPTPEQIARAEAINRARIEGEKNIVREQDGLRAPRIRHDWRDVLYDEDPSQDGNRQKALGDLTGAQFSFAHDEVASTDTWTMHGAVILPYTRAFNSGSEFTLRSFAIAPSATFDRVSTNGNPAVEQNTILYRVGVYMDFLGLAHATTYSTPPQTTEEALRRANEYGPPYGLQLRAAGVDVTDFDHRAELRGYEVDIEPRWLGGPLPLGYRKVILRKQPLKSDGSDISSLECQLRVWLHLEGGDVQDTGPAWTTTQGSFFRMGPTVQFSLRAPALPGGRSFSLTTLYTFLPAISGSSSHDSFFRSTLAYDLFRDPEINHKVSVTADYQRGGLTFTKQEVDQFTLGLAVLF
jgi:hypothetical protein